MLFEKDLIPPPLFYIPLHLPYPDFPSKPQSLVLFPPPTL